MKFHFSVNNWILIIENKQIVFNYINNIVVDAIKYNLEN